MAQSSYQKFPSLQASFDTVNKKFVDVSIPSGMGKVDLSQSQVSVNILSSIPSGTAANAALPTPPVFEQQYRIKNSAIANGNELVVNADMSPNTQACLVRHAELRSARLGIIESIRNVDLLRNMRNVYLKNAHDQEQERNRTNNATQKEYYTSSGHLEKTAIGSDFSRNRVRGSDLLIDLKDIFNYCNNKCYDTDKNGELSIHMEMNFPSLDAETKQKSNTTWIARNVNGATEVAGVATSKNADLDVKSVPSATAAQPGEAANVALNLGTKFRTSGQYADLRDSPYFVGQEVFIKASCLIQPDGNGATSVVATGVISKIERALAASTGTGLTGGTEAPASDALDLTVTFSTAGGMVIPASGDNAKTRRIAQFKLEIASGAIGNAVLAATGTQVFDIQNVELVAAMDSQAKEQSPYSFTTYHVEEDQFSETAQQLNRNYDIPANTRNVYVMFGRASQPHCNLSVCPTLTSYRFAVDNEDILGRAVNYDSPLHKELINQVFTNSADRIHSMEGVAFANQASVASANSSGHGITMLALPVELKNVVQKLSVELQGSGAGGKGLGGRLYFFYERIKSV